MQNPTVSRIAAGLTRKRMMYVGIPVLAAVILPVSFWTLREDRLEAQNPMGDGATAAESVETVPSPAAPGSTEGVGAVPGGSAAIGGPSAGEADVAAGGESRRPAVSFGSSVSASAECLARHQELLVTAAAAQDEAAARRAGPGRDAASARRHGWYPAMPDFRDGSLLPCARIVAYYGHPASTRMGALGEYPKDEMLRRLSQQVAEWEEADPLTPVIPALHMVAVVAQAEPGRSGHYRTISTDARVSEVHDWAREAGAIFFVDIQTGTEDLRALLPRFEWILKEPDVHLGVDPEFMMRDGVQPGRRVGTTDAADINYAIDYLADLVDRYDLPPKVLVIHRFTRGMVTNAQRIRLRPQVQFVMHMDGHGRMQGPAFKFDTYANVVVPEPVQFAGWKNFYHHDNEKGSMPTPAELMRLHPLPLYIQYQ
jgi:hypothetical protein